MHHCCFIIYLIQFTFFKSNLIFYLKNFCFLLSVNFLMGFKPAVTSGYSYVTLTGATCCNIILPWVKFPSCCHVIILSPTHIGTGISKSLFYIFSILFICVICFSIAVLNSCHLISAY